jgi:hypothetical protein
VAIAHGGTGAPTHLASLQVRLALGFDIALVGYRGGGPQLDFGHSCGVAERVGYAFAERRAEFRGLG